MPSSLTLLISLYRSYCYIQQKTYSFSNELYFVVPHLHSIHEISNASHSLSLTVLYMQLHNAGSLKLTTGKVKISGANQNVVKGNTTFHKHFVSLCNDTCYSIFLIITLEHLVLHHLKRITFYTYPYLLLILNSTFPEQHFATVLLQSKFINYIFR